MTYTPKLPEGYDPAMAAGLVPMRQIEGFLDEDSFMRPMIQDVVERLPCFKGMHEFCAAEDALACVQHCTLTLADDAEPGGFIARLRAGIPLMAKDFDPFTMMANGDAALLPKVTVLLEATDTWLLVQDRLPGGGTACLVYAWHGGKAYYAANPASAIQLKSMVDKDEFQARLASVKSKPVAPALPVASSAVEQAVEAANQVRRAEAAAAAAARSQTPLQRLRDAGFSPVGTDEGPAMEKRMEDGERIVVSGSGGLSLARCRTYMMRRYTDDTLQSEQADMDVEAVFEAMKARPLPTPS